MVVAPDGDRSGIAHALSIHHPVRIRERRGRSVKTYECSGTPADCVVVGSYELFGALPDLVVSGINRGANAGDDITYSGTIAAANEALLVGAPSIAVSLAIAWPVSNDEPYWQTAAACRTCRRRSYAACA
jgi:5'-nucleotidase